MSWFQNLGTRRRIAGVAIGVAVFISAALSWFSVSPGAAAVDETPGIFEIRVYNVKPGKMDAFASWMEKATKWQESVGMHILGQFAAPDQNKYVWIRKYPDEATRQRLFQAVYGSGGMKQFGDAREAGFDGSEVFLAKATTYSKLQYAAGPPEAMSRHQSGAGGPVIYEIRIYDIKPGMMDTFVKYMGERRIPWQENVWKTRILAQFVPYGIVSSGTVTPEHNTYVWVRVFQNEADRVEKYKQYEPQATKDMEAKIGMKSSDSGINKARIIIRANPTNFSKLQ